MYDKLYRFIYIAFSMWHDFLELLVKRDIREIEPVEVDQNIMIPLEGKNVWVDSRKPYKRPDRFYIFEIVEK